jgi:choloylglycine hydrolase
MFLTPVMCCVLTAALLAPASADACSTFMLKKGGELFYGHNLNEGDIGVPGMVFVNKRGVFKEGRTLSELMTRDGLEPSALRWISRFGSVTFNNFGKDLPDGGMNEAGLYIWEMNEEADYPTNDELPRLMHANWMQFVLDNYATLDDAINSTNEVVLDGWTWHYFLGDAEGNTATLAFIDGEVVVHRGDSMPVPGLFNTPYDRELEILEYFEGFGGMYEPALDDPNVPRFVKTAVMVRDYDPSMDAVAYGFRMLDALKVQDVPEWSILIDARRRDIYFKTRIHPTVKRFSMNDIDFSNSGPTLVLDIDFEGEQAGTQRVDGSGGFGVEVGDRLHPLTPDDLHGLLTSVTEMPGIPEEFFTSGGLTVGEFVDRFAGHHLRAENTAGCLAGTWTTAESVTEARKILRLALTTDGAAISGSISNWKAPEVSSQIEHIGMIGNRLSFTFRLQSDGRIMHAEVDIDGDRMTLNLSDIEDFYGTYALERTSLDSAE